MSMPGFSARDSLYRTNHAYVTTGSSSLDGVVPQLAAGLSPSQLEFCRLICEYCRYYGYGCYACWYCAIIIVLGGERAPVTA